MKDVSDVPYGVESYDLISDATVLEEDPAPQWSWRHALRDQWNKNNGCVCASVLTQGGVHSLCVLFAGVSGVGSSSLSRFVSGALQGNGLIGLTAAETFQYIVAPAMAVPISYGVDRLRKSRYSLSKAGIAIAVSAGAAVGIAYKWPHQHNADMASIWFEAQPKDAQQKIIQFARETNQTVDDVALGMCGSDQKVQDEMDRLKTPAHKRVYEYLFK